MSGRHTDMTQHIGKTYNYLTVNRIDSNIYSYKGKNIKRSFFECTCICGTKKFILASNVLNNSIKSCGCKKRELINIAVQKLYKDNNKKSVEKRVYSSYKKHGKDFLLSFEEFDALINKNCHYCGTEPNNIRFNKNKELSVKLNGIDRIDSNVGYTLSNCVPCCTTCNLMKNILTQDKFIEHINKIYLFNYPEFKGR